MKLIENASADKLRGGFYTPSKIASFILKWGINGRTNQKILEPSCGDGAFLEQLKNNNHKYKSITAIELDKIEAIKAKKLNVKKSKVINADFHVFCNTTKERYDLVVGNPPYIRYQYFNRDQQREAARVFSNANLKYSKLTNAWVSFVVGSSLLLKDTGKIGFVIPSELLQVKYAQQLRRFLAQFFNKINIVSFKKLVFPNIQQEVVLLLCEKNSSKSHLIEHIELKDEFELETLNLSKLIRLTKKVDFESKKWTSYFLDEKEIDFLETVKDKYNIPTIGKYSKVEVGITTGSNSFFTIPRSIVKQYELERFVRPMVGRSVQVNSVIFSKEDWKENVESNAKAHLIVFPNKNQLDGHEGAKAYIQYGKNIGISEGYKTGIRDDWFVVPSIKLSEALFIRRNNIYPRLILNEAKAYTTDTMHRVFIHKDTVKRAGSGSSRILVRQFHKRAVETQRWKHSYDHTAMTTQL